MAEPTTADAVALLTDPTLREPAPRERIEGHVQMRGAEIVDRLAGPDDDRVNARTLDAEALMAIGGLDRSGFRPPTEPASDHRRRSVFEEFVEDYWTPETAFAGGGD